LEQEGKTYFVTFATRRRLVLPERARDIAFETIAYEHRRSCYLHCAVVMPDHVYALFTPLGDWTVPKIERRMKGISSWRINGLLLRSGALWESESFDRALRSGEDLVNKADYICANPVRAGLVVREDEYRWICEAGKKEDRHECLSSTEKRKQRQTATGCDCEINCRSTNGRMPPCT
jgi:putative transposase